MAAHCSNHIRVRLHFEYPPPAVVDCRMCWLLVDLNACRMVSDLESIIRDKFEFSRRSIINLFIEDCYLLHTESIYVVRDNDILRVKVECASHLNGYSSHSNEPSENCKKRQRPNEPNNSDQSIMCVERMEKKRKKKHDDILEVDTNTIPGAETNDLKNKLSKKKRQKKVDENGLTSSFIPAFSPPQTHKDHPNSKMKKISHHSKSPITPSSDDRNTCVQDGVPKTTGSKTDSSFPSKVLPSSKVPSSTRPAKSCCPPSSSHTDSLDEDGTVDQRAKDNDITNINLRLNHNSHSKLSSSTWKKQSVSISPCEQITVSQESRDKDGFGEKADPVTPQTLQQSLSMGEGSSQDYSAMPLLAAPPQVGKKIAFKLLELTENYTPEVSEYKEGMIVRFDPITKQIELELLSAAQAPSEPGKFDLVYQNPDGSEIVEYAVSRGSRVTERWESLLEPRLII
ncbi:coilin [Festucalex cinctus]